MLLLTLLPFGKKLDDRHHSPIRHDFEPLFAPAVGAELMSTRGQDQLMAAFGANEWELRSSVVVFGLHLSCFQMSCFQKKPAE
jgi:hypothetical protein